MACSHNDLRMIKLLAQCADYIVQRLRLGLRRVCLLRHRLRVCALHESLPEGLRAARMREWAMRFRGCWHTCARIHRMVRPAERARATGGEGGIVWRDLGSSSPKVAIPGGIVLERDTDDAQHEQRHTHDDRRAPRVGLGPAPALAFAMREEGQQTGLRPRGARREGKGSTWAAPGLSGALQSRSSLGCSAGPCLAARPGAFPSASRSAGTAPPLAPRGPRRPAPATGRPFPPAASAQRATRPASRLKRPRRTCRLACPGSVPPHRRLRAAYGRGPSQISRGRGERKVD